MKPIYPKEFLLKALVSDQELLAMWGAYQLLSLYRKLEVSDLNLLLDSEFADIREAGVAMATEGRAQELVPRLVKIFREDNGQLKYAAAYGLAHFPNDFSKNLLQRWFDRLVHNEQATRLELESAAYSYLSIDPKEHFAPVLVALREVQPDGVRAGVLLAALLQQVQDPAQLNLILDEYFLLRDQHNDPAMTSQLVQQLASTEICDWLAGNLARGYKLSLILEQCLNLLDVVVSFDLKSILADLDQAVEPSGDLRGLRPKSPAALFGAINHWLNLLTRQSSLTDQEKLLLTLAKHFLAKGEVFFKAIPKMMEMELLLLVSLPLLVLLERKFALWTQNPNQHLEKIAAYYHSSLLLLEHREAILSRFFPQTPDWSKQELKVQKEGSPITPDSPKGHVLWSLLTGELKGYHINWPMIFPNPDHSAHLPVCLEQYYLANFEYYLARRDGVALDYAIQIFCRRPSQEKIDLLFEHFDYLHSHHQEVLYQAVEYMADPRFIQPLAQRYHDGEYETAELVGFLCSLFGQPLPQRIADDLKIYRTTRQKTSGMKTALRLHCPSCGNTFRYGVNEIYVDESALSGVLPLGPQSIWCNQDFHCKQCQEPLPFVPDGSQMEELNQLSRVERILSLKSAGSNPIGQKLFLIPFPRFAGRTYNPKDFKDLVADFETSPGSREEDLLLLRKKLARLQMDMEDWSAAARTLELLAPALENKLDWRFQMGFVHFKQNAFPQARPHFDWIIQHQPKTKGDSPQDHLVEQAKYFLKTMEAKKRSHFQLIEGGR